MQVTERDKRTIKLGAVCVVAMVAIVYLPAWLGHWRDLRASIDASESLLKRAERGSGAQQAGLLAIVPTFHMSQAEEKQKFLFRDRVRELIKTGGLKAEPLQMESKAKRRGEAHQRVMLNMKAKCQFGQLLDFLVSLKTNPYYVGIETLKIDCDPAKPAEARGDIDIQLSLYTYAK